MILLKKMFSWGVTSLDFVKSQKEYCRSFNQSNNRIIEQNGRKPINWSLKLIRDPMKKIQWVIMKLQDD